MNASPAAEHFDVLIAGAGISGIAAAHHLNEQCPGKSFVILEMKETFGGTWTTHTYPGVRSDSDLYTFGYRFKPWTGVPVASGEEILNYMGEVIEEDQTDQHIRYSHKITKTSWSSDAKAWTVTATKADTGEEVQFTCNFLFMCQGYYDHDNPYTPEWKGMDDFKGDVIHPQLWPENYDYKGKRVIVIGSGATAATIIPAMADDAEHITMVQRSPTYFWSGVNRNELADQLRGLDIPEEWTHEIVRQNILKISQTVQEMSKSDPDLIKSELLKGVLDQVGDEEIVKKHFTPTYRPWQQRLAYVPDGDLFKAVKDGKVSLVTDHIERFTEDGLLMQSGEEVKGDIIITATGFNLLSFGGIDFDVDGKPVDFSKTWTHRGIMLSGLPNMVSMFGYLRTSWTMRVDLVCDYVCRFLNHMDDKGVTYCMPTLQGDDLKMEPQPWMPADEFNPGYIQRSNQVMPQTGTHAPWTFNRDYYSEKDEIGTYDLDDKTMVYS